MLPGTIVLVLPYALVSTSSAFLRSIAFGVAGAGAVPVAVGVSTAAGVSAGAASSPVAVGAATSVPASPPSAPAAVSPAAASGGGSAISAAASAGSRVIGVPSG